MKDRIHHPVVYSMLWSAYADALGFMSELVDRSGLLSRTGRESVSRTVPWGYRVGGRQGTEVPLPAGMYSDDTQLRLATARAISCGGVFNVEAFSKVELPVWLSYALGGGKGTKAAAANLSRDNISWCSNFYSTADMGYLKSGGNGACMRIQPHVWATGANFSIVDLTLNVTRNTISTHGHPRAIVGALLHAFVLADALHGGELPPPSRWLDHLARIKDLPAIIASDEYLGVIWMPAWERQSGSLSSAISEVVEECVQDITEFMPATVSTPESEYLEFLRAIGGMDRAIRGSGTKTAIAALALAWMFRNDPERGVLASANALGSDTDTIGTMAGALLGLVTRDEPLGEVSDRELLIAEANRLIEIAGGAEISDFSYPSLLTWKPPRNASDSVGLVRGRYGVAGLGAVTEIDSNTYSTNERQQTSFRWVRTTFGQTMLVKIRHELQELRADQLPATRAPFFQPAPLLRPSREENEKRAVLSRIEYAQSERGAIVSRNSGMDAGRSVVDLDKLTQAIINAGFDHKLIGESLMILCDEDQAIEKSIAFASILAKAKMARRNR